MAILNRASDGLVSVLVALVRSSIAFGEMPKQKLLDICCPKSLVGDKQEKGRQTLNRWHELGLFVISEKEQIQVTDEFRSRLKKTNAATTEIADVALRVIFKQENNLNFWSAEENKSSDFTRAVAWMLSQDVHKLVPTSHPEVEHLCNSQAVSSEIILLQNNTRWNGYVSWATFLGFGRSESGSVSGGFITDPTPAIRRYAIEILPKGDEVPINEYIENMSLSIPVLDGGDFRKMVESKLNPDKWTPPGPGKLSTSLSRALLRLRAMGEIRLIKKSDSDLQMSLIGRNSDVIEWVTHVTRGDTP